MTTDELKKEVEALLFASAKALSLDELSVILKKPAGDITEAVETLKQDYESRNAPLMVVAEGVGFKLTVKDLYIPIVQKIMIETELPKTVMETLAVIAYKHPALQSEIIKVRTNKAYDHLRELEELGYIQREPYKRTKKIKLTVKFFEYFDIPHEKLREAFSGFEAIEKMIEQKQTEARALRDEIKKKQEARKMADDEKKKNVEAEVQQLDEQNKEMLGSMEVVEELPLEAQEEQLGALEVVKVPFARKKKQPAPEAAPVALPEEQKKQEAMEKEADKIAASLIGDMLPPKSQEKPQPAPTKEEELDEAIKEVEEAEEKLEDHA